MIEYVVLAGSAGIFVLVLAVTGAAVMLRPSRPPIGPGSPAASPAIAGAARGLIDAIDEIQRDAAATELVKALSDPKNNPRLPGFLSAKPAPAPAPAPNGP